MSVPKSSPGAGYPKGSFNAHWFNFFNAVAFQIMMGAPVILFAKSLGASSTVLGIIAAFTPLMTIFQLPAARFLDRIGYKEFVLMGWSLRTVFIFLIALIPLFGFLDDTSKLAVMLAALFLFNLLRGISSAAWMPWITALIPENNRGRFLSLDQIFIHVGCLLALLASAVVMQGHVDNWEYALVFGISGVGATLSLVYIKKIPDIPLGETTKRSAEPVPWGAIWRYEPFRRLLVFNVVFMAVIGSLGVFTVEYLREIPRFEPDMILSLSAVSFAGALLSLPFIGRIVDKAGSRPVIFAATSLLGIVIFGWFLLASGAVRATFVSVAVLNFFAGIAGSNFHLANARLVMLTMPEMGRNHFFALFSVVTSLGLGAAPVLWGVSLDAIGTYELTTGWFVFRRHSIYFLAVFLMNFAALALVFFLVEKSGTRAVAPGLVYGRLKRSSRYWLR